MRAVWITRAGGPEALEVRETAESDPAPGQVRIRVRAAGLCFADVMAAQGLYPDAPKPPCVVGYEVAGVVDALGDGSHGHTVGRRVLAMTHFGGHADVVCVPAEQVLPIPDAMSFETAAAIPVNYLTAHRMLFRVAGIRPGERVLVHMAAGGVGTAVLQLMNHNRTVSGVNIGRLWGEVAALREELLAVLSLWDQGRIKPRIDGSYSFAEAAAAHRRLLQRQNVGKVLLTP
jgi:synaptic vesicle membrane protein VAT-1